MPLEQSLSVVLPVYNAEHSLTEKVHKLLDLLPDLTPRFEILVVDDGSSDQTGEIAYELSREYPQVHMVQHGSHLGWSGVIATALQRAWGEVLFVQDEGAEIDSSEFQRLWALRGHQNLNPPMAHSPQSSLMSRLAAWGVRLEQANQKSKPGGLQMIRREPNVVARRAAGATSATNSGKFSRTDSPTSGEISLRGKKVNQRTNRT